MISGFGESHEISLIAAIFYAGRLSESPVASRSMSANCDTYHRAYQRMTHGIGIRTAQPMLNSAVRHKVDQPLATKPTSLCVPLMLRQIQRIQAVKIGRAHV